MTETMQIKVNKSSQGKGSFKRPDTAWVFTMIVDYNPISLQEQMSITIRMATLIAKFLYKHILAYVRHIWSRAL